MKYLTKINKYLQRRTVRLDYADIRNTLKRLGEFQSDALLVHSSLSACGLISGGSKTVISVLRDWVGHRVLAMPAHSYCYPTENGQSGLFIRDATPSLVGTITERFRSLPGVVRSCCPTHSLACVGPLARDLCIGHDACETPCGAGTPYARLAARDCAVLLFGVKLDSYTLFHTAEHEAGVPYLYYPVPTEFLVDDGSHAIRTVIKKRQNMEVTRRFDAMENWFENRQFLQRIPLGLGELLYIPHAGIAHAALVARLKEDPYFLVKKSGRKHHLSEAKTALNQPWPA